MRRHPRPHRAVAFLAALLTALGWSSACAPGEAGAGDEPAAGGAHGSVARELARIVRDAVTVEGLEEHTRAIVAHQRPSGSPGENAAIDHIVEVLRADGIPVEVHEIQAFASDPLSATVEVPAAGLRLEAITASFSGRARGLEARLVDVGTLEDLPLLETGTGERLVLAGEGTAAGPRTTGFPDVRGAVVLVDGQPRNVPATVLARLGAAGAVFANPEERLNDLIVTSTWGVPSLLSHHRLPDLPVAQVRRSGGEALRRLLAEGEVRVRLEVEVSTGWKPIRLAVARVPGPEPDAPYVLFGGHIDAWYHGANDEGASNAAMLELARAFHANRDRLRRGLVVAWWPGHSNARYAGSTWFADHFFEEMRDRAVAYVNIDGIGQRDATRFGASTTASLAGLATRVVRELEGEEIRPGRPGRNSDQSFNGVGLPLLQISHGGEYWWWHTPDDLIDKVDFQVLKRDTDLYAEALAELLAPPTLPVDLVAEVEAVGAAIARWQEAAGPRFDLSGAAMAQERLLELARAVQAGLRDGAPGSGLDRALLRFLRPLHRVMYVPLTPYHPDPGVEGSALPGLAPIRVLAQEDPSSDRYRFAEAGLVRERNRLLEALEEAWREGEGLRGATAR